MYKSNPKLKLTFVFIPAGRKISASLRDGFYMQDQIAVVILDVTSCVKYKNVPNWHPDLVRVCQNMPIEFCGEQVNITDQKMKGQTININRKKSWQVKMP